MDKQEVLEKRLYNGSESTNTRFAFRRLKLRKVESSAFSDNITSNNMSKRLGFKYKGTKRKSVTCKADRKVHDENLYRMLSEEWGKEKPKLAKEVERKIKEFP